MRKWEEKYKEIQSGKLDTRISELQEKFDTRAITREELKELEESKRIKDSISKVDNVVEYKSKLEEQIDNIVEYKSKLEEQLKEIKAERDRRKSLVGLNKEAKRLDNELEKLKLERDKAETKLKSSNLSQDQKEEMEARVAGIKNRINKNQEKFSENQLTIAATSKAGGKLAKLPAEKLIALETNISSKILKCNMICEKLMEGYSWDSIDMKLEKWQDRKFTSKKETADKMRDAANVDKKERTKRSDIQDKGTTREDSKEKTGRINSESSKGKEETGKGGPLVEVSEFDRKHPRLAKIKNFFKKMGQSIKDTFTDKEEDLEKVKKEVDKEKTSEVKTKEEEDLEKVKKEVDKEKTSEVKTKEEEDLEKVKKEGSKEKTSEVKAKEEADDFRAYIKVVAEKGMKQADDERLETKKKALKQKLGEQNERDQEER